MEHISFLIWMLFFIPLQHLGDYIGFLAKGKVAERASETSQGLAAITMIVIWFYVGYLLY